MGMLEVAQSGAQLAIRADLVERDAFAFDLLLDPRDQFGVSLQQQFKRARSCTKATGADGFEGLDTVITSDMGVTNQGTKSEWPPVSMRIRATFDQSVQLSAMEVRL
ncbi:MAG: hypothetical protein IPH54_21840 [Rhodoferax sp.]|nr:hypothetical protein [Rhodoferax sp.]